MSSSKILKQRKVRQENTKKLLRELVITYKEPIFPKLLRYLALTALVVMMAGSIYVYVDQQFQLKEQQITQLQNKIEKNKRLIAMQSQVTKNLSSELLSSRIVITQEEKELLERLVEAEAGSEPYEGKIAVVNVVFNRLNNNYYPNTIREVIFQPHQFTPAHTGRINNKKPSIASVNAVEEALNGKKVVPDNTLFFVSLDLATDFTVPNTRPRIMSIGNHTFYR